MLKYFYILLFLINQAQASPLKVAIIDSGLNLQDNRYLGHLCNNEHRDFTETTIDDTIGHGTAIAGLIINYAKDSPYCLVIIKYFAVEASGRQTTDRFQQALRYAIEIKSDLINISGGGPNPEINEYLLISKNLNVIFISAAGNDNHELSGGNCYFPACYDSVNNFVVGSISEEGMISKFSNYGSRVKFWEIGENISVNLPIRQCEIICEPRKTKTSGTSFSTAIKTGKMIYGRFH